MRMLERLGHPSLDDLQMMRDVAHQNVGDGANRHRVAIGRARSVPGGIGNSLEEEPMASPGAFQLDG